MRCNEKTLPGAKSCEIAGERSEIKRTLLRISAGRSRRQGLRFYPFHQELNDGSPNFRGQLPALRDTMPTLQATAATTRASMLSLKHRMAAHGCLAPITRRIGRSQALPDKISRMGSNRVHTHALNVGGIVCPQAEAAAKIGLHQT